MTPVLAGALGAVLGLLAAPLLAGWAVALGTPVEPPRRRISGPPGWWRPRRVATGRLAVTAVLAVATGALCGMASGADASWPAWLVLGVAVVPLGQVDAVHHRLPDAVVLPALALGWVLLVLAGLVQGRPGRGLGCVLAGVVVGAVFLVIALAVPSGLGLGDVKLVALLAAFLAWNGVSFVLTGLVLGFVLGAAVSLVLLLTRRAGWRSAVPLGPPLMAGALIVSAAAALA